MSVPNESPVNTYTGNGVTTKFPVTFQFETQDTLVLRVDGSVAPISDYYWTSDSSFNFYIAPVSGTVIEITRNTPKERDNDYDDNYNTFRPKTLNKDFDRIWRVIQEYLIKIDRNEQGLAQEILDRIQADADMLDYIMNQDNVLKQDYIQRDEALKNYIDQMIALVTGDPTFNGIDAQFVRDESGKTQQEINNKQSVRNRRLVYVDDYGDVGNGQDATQAFRDAVADAGVGGRVSFGDGDYLLSLPTNILNGQEVFGTGKTLLINGFDRTAFARGSVAGLIQWGFSLDGLGTQTTIYSIGTLATATTLFTSTLTLNAAPPLSLRIGSVINLHYFCARVLSIVGNVLTLDRTCPYIRDVGSTVYAFNETNNVYIHDLNIDFNGTDTDIRWGYGILGQGGRSNKIENINGQYIGSKMVQLSKDVDSTIRNLDGFIGTDNFDTGGHGYVLRLSSGTDNCRVENVTGTKVRHVTDVSGAHRNRFFNCKGTLTDGVAHLTHGNSSYDNKWIDCDSEYSSAAYHSWDGDTFTQFIGGDVKGRLTNTSVNYEPSVVLRGQVVTNPAGYSGAKLNLEKLTCTFTAGQSSAMFRYSGTGGATVLIKDSKFTIEADAANTCLIYANGTGAVNITFENCEFDVKKIGAFISMNAASKVTFKNCKLICAETTANTPIISSDGIIEVLGGNFAFTNAGLSFFGLNVATSTLIMDGVTFVNASQVWRRYVTGSSIKIGRNTLINSAFATFPNINWSSIGVANNVPYPALGTWTDGSRIENPTPTAGGYDSYILLGGVWKGVGSIQA